MGDKSGIQWTDATWNPVRGCTRVSEGCRNCYAERQAVRMSGPGGAYQGLVRMAPSGPRWTGEVRCVPELLDQPLRWKRPRLVFVNSMSDAFHDKIPAEFIAAMFGVMAVAEQHTFQLLTKRPERAADWFWEYERNARVCPTRAALALRVAVGAMRDTAQGAALHLLKGASSRAEVAAPGVPEWPLRNLWMGISAEDQAALDLRAPILQRIPAAVRWWSLEPLLGPLNLKLDPRRGGEPDLWTPDWVVVGGESGPGARPCNLTWIQSIVDQCQDAGVPVFVKQLGAWPVLEAEGAALGPDTLRVHQEHPKGGEIGEWPLRLRVRQWPDQVPA